MLDGTFGEQFPKKSLVSMKFTLGALIAGKER